MIVHYLGEVGEIRRGKASAGRRLVERRSPRRPERGLARKVGRRAAKALDSAPRSAVVSAQKTVKRAPAMRDRDRARKERPIGKPIGFWR